MPSGILIPKTGELTLTMGQSAKTSDFVADALETWWQETGPRFAQVKELVINADNGPQWGSEALIFTPSTQPRQQGRPSAVDISLCAPR